MKNAKNSTIINRKFMLTYMRKICNIVFMLSCSFDIDAQSPNQNCMGAIPICQSSYTQSNSYVGSGSLTELNGSNQGCLTTGENNSVWYIINTASAGNLVFTITPTTSSDYDFAVWDLTDKSCSAIASGLPPIRCNYASLANSTAGGLTGLSSSSSNPSIGAGGGSFSSALPVLAGQTFVILINNSSSSSSGYTINFSGSTCQIQDNVAPFIKSDTIVSSCTGPTSIKILLSENIICSSFAANGSDFSLSPATAMISSANSASCSSGGAYTNLFNLTFSAPLTPGNYTISIVNGTDGNTLIDNCGNAASVGSSINFTVSPAVVATATSQFGCAGTPSGVITVGSIGGSSPFTYKLNSGAYTSNNVFSGLFAGTYTITIKDNNGCTDDTIISLTQGIPLSINSAIVTNLTCYGNNTGSVVINAAGGTPPLTYALGVSPYTSSNTISNLAPGNYIVHVKDANGCIKDTLIFISSPGQISINSCNLTNATCNTNNGSITINAYGGLPALSYAYNSSAYQATGFFTGLAAGTYTLHIKDANNCIKDTVVVIQQISSVAISSLSTVQPSCAGNSGSITVSGSGGTSPYSYSINGLAYTTSTTFSSLSSGSFTVTIKDANGCTATSSAVLNSPANLFFSSSSIITPTCLIQGSIMVNGTGGLAPYQFALGSGAYSTVNTFTPLVAGTYLVHIKDANGCIHDTSITLANTLVPTIASVTSTNPSCSFPNIGSITINGIGGAAPLTYSLNNAPFVASNVYNGLSGGTYTVVVKDANGCTHSSVVLLNTPNTLFFSNLVFTNVGCNGLPLATITGSVSGGNGPYQYSVNGSAFQTSGNFNGLNAGIYTVVGKDASGCTVSFVITITSSATLSFTNITTTSSPCFTPSTGTIQVSGIASAMPVTYSLNNGAASSSGLFPNLSPGIYTVSINDANGCKKDSLVTITGPSSMYFTNTTINIAPCAGGLGSIEVYGTGGAAPYTYSLNGGTTSTNSVWNPLVAGTYTVHLIDANGCWHDTVIDLIAPPPVSFASITSLNAACSGAATGSINITGTGGISPYTFAINGGTYSTSSNFTGLGAGSYIISIKDQSNCTKDTIIILSNNGNFTINTITKIQPTCFGGNNGTITFTASGGVAPYQYAINSGVFSATNTFVNLASSTFTLRAKDASTCFKDSVITLTQPAQIGFASILKTPTLCIGSNNGTATATGIGGTAPYEYKMDAGIFVASGVFTGLSAGIHTLSIKDAKNCTRDSIIQILPPAPIYFSNANVINPGCTGPVGTITLNAIGGTLPYQYAIGSGAYSTNNIFSNLPIGTFTLHVKDDNGCTHDTVIAIITSQLVDVDILVYSPYLCPGASNGYVNSLAITSFPPLQYSLNGGVPQSTGLFTGLGLGTYTVHINDQNGCFVDSIINIQLAPPIQLNSLNITAPLCHNDVNGKIVVNAIGGIGGLQYSLNNGAYSNSNSFLNLSSGIYTLHIRDSLLCTSDTIIQLLAPPPIYFSSINLVLPYCTIATDGKITINATGGQAPYEYAINTSLYTTNNVFQNLFQGTYTVHVKDYNGCTHDTVVQLMANNYMSFGNVILEQVKCKFGNDGSISLAVNGGVSPYQFSINTISTGMTSYFGFLGAGSYTINVVDAAGCEADTVINILEPSFPVQAQIVNITPNLCRGDSIGSITAGGLGGTSPYTYAIDGTTFQVSTFFGGLPAGIYSITIKDANGCIDDSIAWVIEPDTSVQLSLLGLKDVSCINVNDGSIEVTSKYGVQPITFYLNGSSVGLDTFYNNLNPGNYIVEVKDSLGCKSTGKFIIKPSDRRPYIIVDSIQNVLCAGDKTGFIDWHTINTFPPYYYTFDSISIDTLSDYGGITNGSYFIQVTDSIGCYADTTVVIKEIDTIDVKALATPALCQGLGDDGKATVEVIGGVEPFNYTWSGSTGNSNDHAENLWYGEHTVYVKDRLGCVDSAKFTIEYDPCCKVNLPNAFSPNNDGVNDIFKVIKFGYITIVSFEVYNRWGNQLFSSTNEAFGWDGKYKGTYCELGTYFYLLRYKCHLKNETFMLKGDINLIR